MVDREKEDQFINCIIGEKIHRSAPRLKNYLNFVFKEIDFSGKKVLDVGGGTGIFSVFACVRGAEEVICLEPELSGSDEGPGDTFNRLRSRLGISKVRHLNSSFQNFRIPDYGFDIIILHHSINHLNEEACSRLHHDPGARVIYGNIFKKLYRASSRDARVIVCDCARTNLWPLLGIKNPFNPTIEWHKHQNPELWIKLFSEAGFMVASLGWSAFNCLGEAGRFFLGNFLGAFFTLGHFRLVVERYRVS